MISIKGLNIGYSKKLLYNASFSANKGEVTIISGESGCGKTSLLYRIALVSNQSNYDYFIGNKRLDLKNEKQISNLRRQYISFVLQSSQIIDFFTVKENLEYFASFTANKLDELEIMNILDDVGLKHPNQLARTLSQGEKQRLAIACVLIRNTDIIILDEPTSALDYQRSKEIFELLYKIAHRQNKCIIISSHDMIYKDYCDKEYIIKDKSLVCIKDTKNKDFKYEIIKLKNIEATMLFKYVICYIKKFKKRFIQLSGTLLLSYLVVIFVYMNIQNTQKESINNILSISLNQVYISLNEYVDQNSKPIAIKDIQPMLTIDNDIYPYIYCETTFKNQKINVIPYFKDDQFKNMIEHTYSNNDYEGIYLSDYVYQMLKRNNITTRMFEFNMEMQDALHNKEEIKVRKNVRGILKSGVNNHYILNDYYIYVPYDYIKEQYNKYFSSQEFIGYTVISKDFNKHKQLIEKLNNNSHYQCNDEFQNNIAIDKVINNYQIIEMIIIIVVLVITMIMISYLFIQSFNARKKEFVLSLISGMQRKDIIRLNMIEYLLAILISIICLLPILLIVYHNIIDIILIVVCENILSYIMILIMNMIQMSHLSVENVLRV